MDILEENIFASLPILCAVTRRKDEAPAADSTSVKDAP
jgi:hypothetical protein